MLCGSGCRYLRRKVFEEGSGYGGEEVDVGGRVKTARKVVCDRFDVRRCRFDEVNNRNVGNWVSCGIDISGAGR